MKQVISFSLYGSDRRYTENALVNAAKLDDVYPGWLMRVYYDNTVPASVIHTLAQNPNVELVNMAGSPIQNKMMWRFCVVEDTGVDMYVVRDIDSHISAREKHAVDEWIASRKRYHVMRDHPSHCNYAMSGGMWGGKYDSTLHTIFKEQFARFNRQAYLLDMNLLNAHFWNHVKHDVLVHDSFQLTHHGACQPFPRRRVGAEHVGSVIIDGKMRQGDVDILLAHSHLEKHVTR